MFIHIKKIFNDWFTGPDGVTYDPARSLWIIGIIAFLLFTAHGVYRGKEFDMVNFGLAYGGLLAAGAAGVKIKETSEPPALSPPMSPPSPPIVDDPSLKPPKI